MSQGDDTLLKRGRFPFEPKCSPSGAAHHCIEVGQPAPGSQRQAVGARQSVRSIKIQKSRIVPFAAKVPFTSFYRRTSGFCSQ
jgi:hypothetical protein